MKRQESCQFKYWAMAKRLGNKSVDTIPTTTSEVFHHCADGIMLVLPRPFPEASGGWTSPSTSLHGTLKKYGTYRMQSIVRP